MQSEQDLKNLVLRNGDMVVWMSGFQNPLAPHFNMFVEKRTSANENPAIVIVGQLDHISDTTVCAKLDKYKRESDIVCELILGSYHYTITCIHRRRGNKRLQR